MKTRHGKSIAFFIATIFACVFVYIANKNSDDKFDLSKINEFYQFSGLGPFPENKIVYFNWGPQGESRGYSNYEIAIKLEKNEAAKISENPIFSKQLSWNSPPPFSQHMKSIPKANSYTIAKGIPSGRSSMTLTIGDYSDFSYVYINMTHVYNK